MEFRLYVYENLEEKECYFAVVQVQAVEPEEPLRRWWTTRGRHKYEGVARSDARAMMEKRRQEGWTYREVPGPFKGIDHE